MRLSADLRVCLYVLILLEKAKVSSITLSENSIILTNPKFGSKNCSIQIVPLNKISKFNNAVDILISFQENTFVEKIITSFFRYFALENGLKGFFLLHHILILTVDKTVFGLFLP